MGCFFFFTSKDKMVATCWKRGWAHHWQHQPKGSLASRMALNWANWTAVGLQGHLTKDPDNTSDAAEQPWPQELVGSKAGKRVQWWVPMQVSGVWNWTDLLTIPTAGVFPFLYFPHSVLLSEWLSMPLLLWELDSELPHPLLDGLLNSCLFMTVCLTIVPASPWQWLIHICWTHTHCWLSA